MTTTDDDGPGSPGGASKVGYKNPPQHTRFKKGQRSANPKGRPRGTKGRSTLEKVFEREIPITQGNRRRSATIAEAVATRLVKKALEGDAKAIQQVLKIQLELEKLSFRRQISPEDAVAEFKEAQKRKEFQEKNGRLLTSMVDIYCDLLEWEMIDESGDHATLRSWVIDLAKSRGTYKPTPRVLPKQVLPSEEANETSSSE